MRKKRTTLQERRTEHMLMRFCTATVILGEVWAQEDAWSLELHPCLTAQLQGDALSACPESVAELETRLLAAWNRYEDLDSAPFPHRAELLAALELTLAKNENGFVRYIETVQATLSQTDRAGLWHMARVRLRSDPIRDVAYRALFPENAMPEDKRDDAACFLTKTQEIVAEKLIRLGRAFFDQTRVKFPIQPKLCPLLVGKTGAGKGHVISHVAKELRCHVVHVTFGDWVVNGAHSDYMPTLWAILAALLKHERVIVVLDEIDKFDTNFLGGELSAWSRSACNELWALLDRRLPVEQFLKSPKTDGTDSMESAGRLYECIKSKLWIVGIGTWQHLHKAERPRLGFACATYDVATAGIAEKLAIMAGISPELLYRFNPTPIELNYPPFNELEVLLEQTGIAKAARARGISLDMRKLDLSRGGMRVIEDLVTEIIITETSPRSA